MTNNKINDIDIKDLKNFNCLTTLETYRKLYEPRSLKYADAKVLCTIIRKYNVSDILELGTYAGLSCKIMVNAVRRNWFGHIITVDLWGPGEVLARPGSPKMGELLSEQDRKIVTFVTSDALTYLESLPENCFDMIFEDSNHAARMIEKAVPLILRALRPNGIALFHNSDWESVKLGIKMAGKIDELHYFANGSTISMLRKGS